jgi:hypothetical protein
LHSLAKGDLKLNAIRQMSRGEAALLITHYQALAAITRHEHALAQIEHAVYTQ